MHISNNIVFWNGMGFDLWIILMTVVVIVVIGMICALVSSKLRWIPRGWQSLLEMTVEFIENSVSDSLGPERIKYTYFFGSLFLFILVSNMLGLIPGLASPTRDISITLSLAFMVLIWMQYIGIKENGMIKHFKGFFSPTPLFFPLHLLELVTRPLTLALRLFGNIFAGEILIEKLTETFYLVVPSVWLLMSIVIGAIQAYIFTVLSLAYTGLSLDE